VAHAQLLHPPSASPLLPAEPPDRVQKLKDARSEAAKEIEEYKAAKEAEFKKFENEVSCGCGCVLGCAR
jgi:hypothetical protein